MKQEQFSNIESLIHIAELSLKSIQDSLIHDPLDVTLCQAEKDCMAELNFLKKAQYEFLKHKAKINWHNEGDENTKVFHTSI